MTSRYMKMQETNAGLKPGCKPSVSINTAWLRMYSSQIAWLKHKSLDASVVSNSNDFAEFFSKAIDEFRVVTCNTLSETCLATQ